MSSRFAHIENWVFDLDNTLYPPDCALFDLIDDRMRLFIAGHLSVSEDEAHQVQKGYFRDHGTTLAGMMANHGVEPQIFLDFVHDIDMSRLITAPRLRNAIGALPGRKIVFTNGDADYAMRVLLALDLDEMFDSICDIHDMDYIPKPDARAYQALLDKTDINPAHSLFVEDMARNLAPAKAIGMSTIWVNNGSEYGNSGGDPAIIDLEISNVADWLMPPQPSEGHI